MLVRKTYYSTDTLYSQAETYVLNLDADAELFNRLSQNRKRQVRSWQQLTPQPRAAKKELAEFVIRESPTFYESRNAWNPIRPETWEELFTFENVHVLGVKDGETVIAASVFAWSSDIGEYLANISLPEGMWASAGLLWEGARWLRSRGVRSLNLGGPARPEYGLHDGVAEFKKRFGAVALSRYSLKEIYDPRKFSDLCATTNADPSDLRGFFPPYRIN